jgi:hypothetical protein
LLWPTTAAAAATNSSYSWSRAAELLQQHHLLLLQSEIEHPFLPKLSISGLRFQVTDCCCKQGRRCSSRHFRTLKLSSCHRWRRFLEERWFLPHFSLSVRLILGCKCGCRCRREEDFRQQNRRKKILLCWSVASILQESCRMFQETKKVVEDFGFLFSHSRSRGTFVFVPCLLRDTQCVSLSSSLASGWCEVSCDSWVGGWAGARHHHGYGKKMLLKKRETASCIPDDDPWMRFVYGWWCSLKRDLTDLCIGWSSLKGEIWERFVHWWWSLAERDLSEICAFEHRYNDEQLRTAMDIGKRKSTDESRDDWES